MSSIRKSRPRLIRNVPRPELPPGARARKASTPPPLAPTSAPTVDVSHVDPETPPSATRPRALEQVARWRQEGQPVPIQKVSRMLEDLHHEHGLLRQTRPRLDTSLPHVATEAHPSAADIKTRRFLAARKVMDRFWQRLEPRLEAKQTQLLDRADAGERLGVEALRSETSALFAEVHEETFAQLPTDERAEYEAAVGAWSRGQFDAARHFQSGQEFALALCFSFLAHCEAMPRAHAERSGELLPPQLFKQPFVQDGFHFIQFFATQHFDLAPDPFGLSGDEKHGLGSLQLVKLDRKLHLALAPQALPPLDSVELAFAKISELGSTPRFGCPALSAISLQQVNAVGALTHFVQTVAARHVFPTVEAQLAAAGQLATASTP